MVCDGWWRMPGRDLSVASSRPISELKAELFKALAHPARVRILELLSEVEHTVGEMKPLVGLEASHLSQQLAVLRRAGVVTSRKEGAAVVYSLRDPEIAEQLVVAKRLLINSLARSQGLLTDLQSE
jgi:ArsR family transcriptional regulator